jgi:hypothetical protein
VTEHNPSQARTSKDGKPSTVGFSYPHNGERGEEHKVVSFCEEVNNGVQFVPFVDISSLAAAAVAISTSEQLLPQRPAR